MKKMRYIIYGFIGWFLKWICVNKYGGVYGLVVLIVDYIVK